MQVRQEGGRVVAWSPCPPYRRRLTNFPLRSLQPHRKLSPNNSLTSVLLETRYVATSIQKVAGDFFDASSRCLIEFPSSSDRARRLRRP